jgi:hypothetical protein
MFNCQIGHFPVKYLSVLVSPSLLHLVDWLPLVDKSKKKDYTLGRVGLCLLQVEQL